MRDESTVSDDKSVSHDMYLSEEEIVSHNSPVPDDESVSHDMNLSEDEIVSHDSTVG